MTSILILDIALKGTRMSRVAGGGRHPPWMPVGSTNRSVLCMPDVELKQISRIV